MPGVTRFTRPALGLLALAGGATAAGACALWPVAAALAGSTLVSEDLACVAAGQLVRAGQVAWAPAILGCFVGIVAGDAALWLAGRTLGRRALEARWLRGRVSERRLEQITANIDQHLPAAVVTARFVPGLRLPVYVAAGATGRHAGRFLGWALAAAAVWTPLVIVAAAVVGEALRRGLERFLAAGWVIVGLSALICVAIVRLAAVPADPIGRAKWAARVGRLWRWEFWPAWVFYVPVLPYIAYLSIRHRGIGPVAAANPGIPNGGIVGESKFAILRSIRSRHVLPARLIPTGPLDDRLATLRGLIDTGVLSFPLILKPDVGQRGAGVRLAHCLAEAEAYLRHAEYDVIAQAYHPGPHEAGVLYVRHPDEPTGRIFSITDKVFPQVVGDGRSTLEDLVWRHPRYRFQANAFLARHAAARQRVLAAGEVLRLALAGNHCQGTMFRDGAHLITPALTAKIDAIAKTFSGFYFGRFDVRYSDPARFMTGEDLAIVELNGATSESTNIYDPTWSLLRAYRTIFAQWRTLFRIGEGNRRRGHDGGGLGALARDVIAWSRDRRVTPASE